MQGNLSYSIMEKLGLEFSCITEDHTFLLDILLDNYIEERTCSRLQVDSQPEALEMTSLMYLLLAMLFKFFYRLLPLKNSAK